MPIYLDDEPVTIVGENLAAVLDAARQKLEPTGRMVVEVQIDGQTLSGDELQEQAQTAVAASEIRLYSADPRELAIDALDQVRGRLAQVRDDQQAAADLLQQDKGVEAIQKVGDCIAGWMQTQQAVTLAANLSGVDLNTMQVGGKPATESMERLIGGLRSLKDALVHRDTVALADALAYEWPEQLDDWDRLAEELTRQIEGA